MLLRNSKGQLSIFFAVTVVLVLTVVAFVINVGLFVKAKINLQNAVDAAAYSGAAVQSRQLTDIAYLNWEMRNVYKEWMFKYYVLGNLSTNGVKNPGSSGNNNKVNPGGMDYTVGPAGSEDRINIPSVCVFYEGQSDICSVYEITGLPRLSSPGFSNIDELASSIIDSLSIQKSKQCSERSKANFIIATNWTYGTGLNQDDEKQLSTIAPQIAANRPGSWPKSMELALRIRNLEYIVNTPPQTQGVCLNPGVSDNCAQTIDSLTTAHKPHNERTVKAFYSAYRNLGNDFDSEMRNSFTLTEIPPLEFRTDSTFSLSNVLIPESGSARSKYYLDLKLGIVNYAIFYTMMSSTSSRAPRPGGVPEDASCYMTKMGIPVPGYPFGFDKSNQVMTYYAVKGTAKFEGLFNPFGKAITLTAYAAAKPMGGRIGPKIFDTWSGTGNEVTSRVDANRFRSSAYVFGLDFNPAGLGLSNANKKPLLPVQDDFWLKQETDPIGGVVSAQNIRFVVPNLLYDPVGDQSPYAPSKVLLYPLPAKSNSPHVYGLYDKNQFTKFKNNLSNQGPLTAQLISQAISNVRAPTAYEAKNYLIPTPDSLNTMLKLDSFGQPLKVMRIFAPLYGPDYLYKSPQEVLDFIENFLTSQKPSIQKYVSTLETIANDFRNTGSSVDSNNRNLYQEAAAIIHDKSATAPLTCKSIAGMFSYFYLGAQSEVTPTPNCPDPLSENLEKYYQQSGAEFANIYESELSFKPEQLSDDSSKYFSAYQPGPLTGGSGNKDGLISNPFRRFDTYSLRNFYSTKFISLDSLTAGGNYKNSGFQMYSEGSEKNSATGEADFQNFLLFNQASSTSIEEIKH